LCNLLHSPPPVRRFPLFTGEPKGFLRHPQRVHLFLFDHFQPSYPIGTTPKPDPFLVFYSPQTVCFSWFSGHLLLKLLPGTMRNNHMTPNTFSSNPGPSVFMLRVPFRWSLVFFDRPPQTCLCSRPDTNLSPTPVEPVRTTHFSPRTMTAQHPLSPMGVCFSWPTCFSLFPRPPNFYNLPVPFETPPAFSPFLVSRQDRSIFTWLLMSPAFHV